MARDIQEFINRDVAPTITGMDPMRIEDVRAAMLWQLSRKYFTGASGCSASLIDIALWDIKGKATGQPVWKHLGGARNREPAYITFGLGQHTQYATGAFFRQYPFGTQNRAERATFFSHRGGLLRRLGKIPISLRIFRIVSRLTRT